MCTGSRTEGSADCATPLVHPAQREIEKVKQRREQRAAERAQQEEELSLIARQRAEAEGLEAEAKEEEVRSAEAYALDMSCCVP